MPGKIDAASVGVWCPCHHWLGTVVNLQTGRDLYCVRCGKWFSWREIDVGKKPGEESHDVERK